MNKQNAALIQWLRECYREDRTRLTVLDFFQAKIQQRHIIKGEEKLLNGFLCSDHLSVSYGNKLFDRSSLYRREKEVVYGSIFICGKTNGTKLAAPLILYSVNLDKVGDSILASIDFSQWRLNTGLIDTIDPSGEFLGRMSQLLADQSQLCDALVGSIRTLLNQFTDLESTESLLNWPHLKTSGELQNVAKEAGWKAYAASGIAMIDRSRGARGVLDELEQLISLDLDQHSSALRGLLGNQSTSGQVDDSDILVPLVLSESQETIVRSARNQDLTVCHGPPGTGKSLTIAAVAVDHVSRGESVLVVSKMNHAVDVVNAKIDSLLEDVELTVRAGRSSYLKVLKLNIEQYLAGAVTQSAVDAKTLKKRRKSLKRFLKEHAELEEVLVEELEKSETRGLLKSKLKKSWIEFLKNHVAEFSVTKRMLLAEVMNSLHEMDEKRDLLIKDFINAAHLHQLDTLLKRDKSRKHISGMLKALRKTRSSEQDEVRAELDYKILLKAFPVWLCNTEDIHQVLPMRAEMFDLVIVDEASQCDIASILPVLQRAKRVVIAGNAKQLRHISFVSERALKGYADDFEIPDSIRESYHYRKVSVMDLAASKLTSAHQNGFLNEHFRSAQPIIKFSSDRFYQSRLSLMRHRDWEPQDNCVECILCTGNRDKNGVNSSEVEAVTRKLQQVLKEEEKLPKNQCRSIGILSPFRGQVDALLDSLQKDYSASERKRLLEVHQLKIGSAHHFQGEERDMILLSFGIGKEHHSAARRYLEREDVFNVSITRAKHQQVIFHSVRVGDLPIDSLLGAYLSSVSDAQTRTQTETEHDTFSREVTEVLELEGCNVLLDKKVAGVQVDLVVTKGELTFGIDLIGCPGAMERAVSLKRLRLLKRAGLKVFPLGYLEWTKRKQECIDWIKHGI